MQIWKFCCTFFVCTLAPISTTCSVSLRCTPCVWKWNWMSLLVLEVVVGGHDGASKSQSTVEWIQWIIGKLWNWFEYWIRTFDKQMMTVDSQKQMASILQRHQVGYCSPHQRSSVIMTNLETLYLLLDPRFRGKASSPHRFLHCNL